MEDHTIDGGNSKLLQMFEHFQSLTILIHFIFLRYRCKKELFDHIIYSFFFLKTRALLKDPGANLNSFLPKWRKGRRIFPVVMIFLNKCEDRLENSGTDAIIIHQQNFSADFTRNVSDQKKVWIFI